MFGFSLLVPAFLAGATAAAVPILLHLLKRDTAPRLSFSAVHLLKDAPVEQAARRWLRDLILLALRVTALVLLALAFARPYFVGAVAAGVTVVAVDVSFSMSSPGQVDRARELAEQTVRSARPDHAVAVVAFDVAASVVSEASRDRDAALAAIGRLSPGAGATRYTAGLAAAVGAIGARTGHIVLVTDMQRSGWVARASRTLPERVTVTVADVGPPAGNLAVTALRGEPARTVALVLNGGTARRMAELRLLIDGAEVDRTTVTVAPGVAAEAAFPVVLPTTGEATASVVDRDGYAADDARHLVLAPPEPLPIMTVTSSGDVTADAFYLERALLAGDETSRFDIQSVAGTRVSTLSADAPGAPAAVLLLTTRGLDRRSRAAIRAYVEQGGGLAIVAGSDVEPAVATELLDAAVTIGESASAEPGAWRLMVADVRHPIFRAFGPLVDNVSQVRFTRAVPLETTDTTAVLARFSHGPPALVEHRIGAGRVLVFAAGLDDAWSDFPRHPTFVPFVHEMTRYLARDHDRPRELIVGQTPPGVRPEPGFATMGEPARRVAVNVDRAESDPSRVSADEFESAIERLRGATAVASDDAANDEERDQGYWRYAIGLMLVALAAESVFSSRMG